MELLGGGLLAITGRENDGLGRRALLLLVMGCDVPGQTSAQPVCLRLSTRTSTQIVQYLDSGEAQWHRWQRHGLAAAPVSSGFVQREL